MANSSLLKDIKAITGDLIDNNGNFRTIPIGAIAKRNLSEDRLKLLQLFLQLLRDTDMIYEETKMYIFNKYITLKGVTEELNLRDAGKGKVRNGHTTNSRVNYDRVRIQKYVGENFITDVLINNGNDELMNEYYAKIIQALMTYGKHQGEDMRDNIALKLDRRVLCSELDDDRFNSFIQTVLPYLKSHMETVVAEIDKESVGYFNYLVLSPSLSGVNKERYDYMKQLLSPDEINDDSIIIE